MKKFMTLLALAWVSQVCQAQLPDHYGGLDPADLSTGVFLPLAGGMHGPIPNGETVQFLDRDAASEVFFVVNKATFGEVFVPDLKGLINNSALQKSSSAQIPIALISAEYEDFHPEAISNEWVIFDGDQWALAPDAGAPLYESQEVFSIYIDWSDYLPGSYELVLPSNQIYSPHADALSNFSVDFDDGLGFRSVDVDVPITVEYDGSAAERNITFRADKGGSTLQAGFNLKSMPCDNGFGLPDLPPWGSESEAFPWRISTTFNGSTVRGNAYTLMSNDGIFDKPFLFVEGIDFGSEISAYRNGSFGWHTFVCGDSPLYPFLELMPVMLENLRSQGYDIILLDFEDGADFIEKNSALLIKLIELARDYKVGTEELVVSGASMGGQITRIALKQMEDAGNPHCTRLWISMDSPHCGANIPMGLQRTISFLANFDDQANLFLERFLKRPAARQLLLLQLPFVNNIHNQYQAFIDDLGFPEETRNVAIANGSISGNPFPFNPGAPLLDYTCGNWIGDLFKLLMLAAPGDPFHSQSSESTNVIAHNVFTSAVDCNLGNLGDCFEVFSPNILSVYHGIDPNTAMLDNAPGGSRRSIQQFVDAMNLTLASLYEQGKLPNSCSPLIFGYQYQAHHSFIPTTSALGIATEYYHLNVAEALEVSPNLTPFDRVYGPTGYNTEHSEITPEIVFLVQEEVMNSGNLLPATLDQYNVNDGIFNFGVSSHEVIHDLSIENGGRLFVNAQMPIHFNTEGMPYPPALHFDLRTRGCGSVIQVQNDGKLELGHAAFGRTARLELKSGSTLYIRQGGEVKIDENSEIILRSGSEIVLDGGSLKLKNGARILVEEGAQMVYLSGEAIELDGLNAFIDLHGSIKIENGQTLEIIGTGSQGGKIRCFTEDICVVGGSDSELHIIGSSINDGMVEVFPEKALRTSFGFGKLRFINAAVYLHSDARISCGGSISANQAQFSGTPDCYGINVYRGSNFRNSEFINVALNAYINENVLRVEKCNLNRSRILVEGGTYRLSHSNFYRCGVYGEDLSMNAQIRNCKFDAMGHSGLTAVYDDSGSNLLSEENLFDGYHTGIYKTAGQLRMKCTTIQSCNRGIYLGNYALGNLSSIYGAGFNHFNDNGTHIETNWAEALWLVLGNNDFGPAHEWLFKGSLIGQCDENCTPTLPATGNRWPNGPVEPESNMYELVYASNGCDLDSQDYTFEGCYLNIADKAPIDEVACPEGVIRPAKQGVVDKSSNQESDSWNELSNFLLNTPNLDGKTIPEVFTLALGNSSMYLSSGDDEFAVQILTEALSAEWPSGPAFAEARRAGLKLLLSISEVYHANEGLWPLNVPNSSATHERIMEVFNQFSTGPVDSSTEAERLAWELDKIQFLHNQGLLLDLLTEELIIETTACGLPQRELLALENYWVRLRRRALRTASYPAQYQGAPAPTDSLACPINQEAPEGNPQFGAWFTDLNLLEYPLCGAPSYRSTPAESHLPFGVQMHPNPAGQAVSLILRLSEAAPVQLSVRDISGKLCLETSFEAQSNDHLEIDLQTFHSGVYFFTLQTANEVVTRQLVVQR